MATLCKTYLDEAAAARAAELLRAGGVPGRDIRVLVGRPLHDVRGEPAGSFAGTVGPGAPVGTFANVVRRRCQGAGSYAGDPDRQRQGCFADADCEVLVGDGDGAERSHLAGDAAIRRLLRRAAIAGVTAERVVDELHKGHTAVIADVADIGPGDAWARLEDVARAA